MSNSPCYDPKTKTDCPKRRVGCHSSCEEWAEHVKEREYVYQQRMDVLNSYDITHSRKQRNYLRWKQRQKRRGHRD